MAKTPEREHDESTQPSEDLFSSGTLTPLPAVEPSKHLKMVVEVPSLTPEEESNYEAVNSEPHRIVGELTENDRHYVFALFDTIAYRVSNYALFACFLTTG